jgi:hypothetical protein
MSRLRALAGRLARREHALNTVVNTPPKHVHPGAAGVNTLPRRKINDLEPENERVHVFTPQEDERVNTPREREHAYEHGVNTVGGLAEADRPPRRKPEVIETMTGERCRRCGERMRWPEPDGVVYADGTAEHHACRIWAELTARGEPLP